MGGLALVAGPFLFGASASARVVDIRPGQDIGAAATTLQTGDTLRIFPGHYQSCAVLRADDLMVEGVGEAASVVLAGKICQGKAILVAAGRNLVLRNLTLAEAAVPEGNGAGLRAEGGSATVEGVRFVHDQDGILTAGDAPEMVLVVRASVFERDGACVAACAHGIYAGHIARLSVSGSHFRATQAGHAIKSRALVTEVTGCDISDGPEGTGSYLIEAPNGGAVRISGNKLEKGPNAGNKVAIAIGLEGDLQPTPTVVVTGNRFTNDGSRNAVFIENRTAALVNATANVQRGPIK